MNRFDAVLFDMDGVLIDSETRYAEADRRMFEKLGITMTREDSKALVGVKSREGAQGVLNLHPELTSVTVDELDAIYRRSLYETLERATDMTLIPGVEEWLRRLHAAGVRIAVASSSTAEMVGLIVERFGLLRYAQFVINGDQVPRSKPDPEIFLRAAAGVGVPPSRCAVVEDSTFGILAAKRAGMFCLAYTGANVHGLDNSQADARVSVYDEEGLRWLLDEEETV